MPEGGDRVFRHALTAAGRIPLTDEGCAGMVANLYADVRSSERLNQNLQLSGVIITKYERNRLSDMYVEKVRSELGAAFIEPVISKATRIAQAGSFGQSIFDYDPDGKATKQYVEVAQKLALRIMDEE